MTMKKLLEAVAKFAGEPAQKPGDQVRGTDKAKKGGKDHPFNGRLVGDSVEPQGNMLGELNQEAKDKSLEWKLAEAWAEFKEEAFKDTNDKRSTRKGSRPSRPYTKDGEPSQRYKKVAEGWGRGNERVTLPDEPSTYWAGKGALQDDYNRLYDELVPSQGKADTIEGEVLRASSKIVYRHYNDGDEFNQESFEQLVPYIGAVTSYDDLAHKAIEFALKANGNYTPNPSWDSLDVMEYGPTQDEDEDEDDDYEDYDDDETYSWDQDEEELDEVKHFRTAYGWAGGRNEKTGGTYKHPDQIKADREAKKAAKQQSKDAFDDMFGGGNPAKGLGIREGWESGPDEYERPERDPDAEYDARRQEKADAEAQAQQAKRPQTKVYTLTGRGPNMEPNYAFPGEYATQDEADAARARLMADPSTPNPRMIGISSRTKYLDEYRETPLRDKEDYDAKLKAIQDIQTDADTSKDPELSAEVIRRLAGLKKQAQSIGLDVDESRGHKILARKLADIERSSAPAAQDDSAAREAQAKADYRKYVEKMKKENPNFIPMYKIDEYGADGTASATSSAQSPLAATTDPAKAKEISQASQALKAATKSAAPATNIVKAIDHASQGKQVGQQDMKALEPLMKDIATVASEPKLAGQFKSLVQQIDKEQQLQAK